MELRFEMDYPNGDSKLKWVTPNGEYSVGVYGYHIILFFYVKTEGNLGQ